MAVRVTTLFFLAFLSLAALADTLTGKVVKITDGDTLYVLDANYKQHKIRLAGIDAPERRQAYGLASRKHLLSIVAGKQVTIAYQKRDRYGRIVGNIPIVRWIGYKKPHNETAKQILIENVLTRQIRGPLGLKDFNARLELWKSLL